MTTRLTFLTQDQWWHHTQLMVKGEAQQRSVLRQESTYLHKYIWVCFLWLEYDESQVKPMKTYLRCLVFFFPNRVTWGPLISVNEKLKGNGRHSISDARGSQSAQRTPARSTVDQQLTNSTKKMHYDTESHTELSPPSRWCDHKENTVWWSESSTTMTLNKNLPLCQKVFFPLKWVSSTHHGEKSKYLDHELNSNAHYITFYVVGLLLYYSTNLFVDDSKIIISQKLTDYLINYKYVSVSKSYENPIIPFQLKMHPLYTVIQKFR